MVTKSETTMADKAYAQLEKKIATLELKPGEIVSEKEISERFGIGRMPVRLAFKQLELAGLVSSIPRKGILINTIKIEDAFLQLEVRLVLERLLVSRSCRHATATEKEQFLVLAERYASATKEEDRQGAMEIDDEFNRLLGACARNVFAWKAILPLYVLCRRLYFYSYETNKELTVEINKAHIRLMKEIAAADEESALKALNDLQTLNEKLVIGNMSSWLPENRHLV